ncbi:MAG: MerR family transcriptional regulator [Pseudorhodobacter sp.]|nr:MerR family transcriptional regulator [Pseudorhodobacter sp.]
MEKSEAAFRTISEAAVLLDTPAHVLRFWESRFPQIKPVKRAGGRRYYRPADVALLAGIRRLLHDEGMTIRGVQKILREQGVRHVAGLAEPDAAALDAAFAVVEDVPEAETEPPAPPPAATVLPGPGYIGPAEGTRPIAPPAAPQQSAVVVAAEPEPAPPPVADPAGAAATALPDRPAPVNAAAPENDPQPDFFAPASPRPEPVADTSSPLASDPPAPAAPEAETWLPTVLRRLSAPLLTPHLTGLRPLHARLLDLRTRMAKADGAARS